MKRIHVFISGFVHGVFFRAKTRDKANKLNLKGFVRNLPDGRVEAVFEGREEDIENVLDFCRKGPFGAKVKNVEVKEEEYKGEFDDFEIRY